MKNNQRHFIIFLLYSMFFVLQGYTQETTVPNVPEEVRQLPISFKENYKGDAYNYVETVSYLAKIRAWIIDKLTSWFSVGDHAANNIFQNLKLLFYFLIFLAVVYIIVKLILNKEFRWIFKRKTEKAENLEFEIAENIEEVNFDVLITDAIANKDYRLAVRYHYLLLLKKLNQLSLITYDAQKTTYDYQLALEGTNHASGFSKASYYYTYVWYGEFYIDENEYNTVATVYTQLLKSVKHA